MHVILWAVQLVLAIKLLTVTVTHAVRPDPLKMQRGLARFGAGARPLLTLIASCTALVSAGLVVPAALGLWAWLTPWCAALTAVLMLISIAFHIACRDKPNIVADLVLLALAAFAAYGRWVLVPL